MPPRNQKIKPSVFMRGGTIRMLMYPKPALAQKILWQCHISLLMKLYSSIYKLYLENKNQMFPPKIREVTWNGLAYKNLFWELWEKFQASYSVIEI